MNSREYWVVKWGTTAGPNGKQALENLPVARDWAAHNVPAGQVGKIVRCTISEAEWDSFGMEGEPPAAISPYAVSPEYDTAGAVQIGFEFLPVKTPGQGQQPIPPTT